MDANMHINLADKMAEYESSFVFKASKMLYPELEFRGEITQNASSKKFRHENIHFTFFK